MRLDAGAGVLATPILSLIGAHERLRPPALRSNGCDFDVRDGGYRWSMSQFRSSLAITSLRWFVGNPRSTSLSFSDARQGTGRRGLDTKQPMEDSLVREGCPNRGHIEPRGWQVLRRERIILLCFCMGSFGTI
jgi:hypothetical protein